jgi:hypothetical protein
MALLEGEVTCVLWPKRKGNGENPCQNVCESYPLKPSENGTYSCVKGLRAFRRM